jgi:hypothetical protein
VLSAAVGGTAAELGGGKFANGAVTAAFLRLYNDERFANRPNWTKVIEHLDGNSDLDKLCKDIAGEVQWDHEHNPDYKWTCSLRVCEALNDAGYTIDAGLIRGMEISRGADGNVYIWRDQDLIQYLQRKYGPADFLLNGSDWKSIANEHGIVVMHADFGAGATAWGHATLYDSGAFFDLHAPEYQQTAITTWFWRLEY